MRGLFPTLALCLLLAALPARAELVSRIAAVVNDDIITTLQLDERIRAELAEEAVEAVDDTMRRSVLDKMVQDLLVDQRIEQLGMSVSDEEVEQAIKDVERQNNIDRQQLISALQAQGLTMESYRSQLHRQLLEFKLVGREIRDQIEVTNHEMRNYYQGHIEDYREDPFLRLSRIGFALPANPTATQRDTLRALSREVLVRLRAGEDFDQVLKAYQEDKGAEGGSLGRFGENELTEPFGSAVVGLQPGQYSDVVETPQGLHILRVDERNPGRVPEFDAVKEQISQLLIEQKRQKALDGWMDNLKKAAHIEIKL